ncbi:hypothetical protein AtNW77_Chr3g0197721 [Arabidopsis thaliana]
MNLEFTGVNMYLMIPKLHHRSLIKLGLSEEYSFPPVKYLWTYMCLPALYLKCVFFSFV